MHTSIPAQPRTELVVDEKEAPVRPAIWAFTGPGVIHHPQVKKATHTHVDLVKNEPAVTMAAAANSLDVVHVDTEHKANEDTTYASKRTSASASPIEKAKIFAIVEDFVGDWAVGAGPRNGHLRQLQEAAATEDATHFDDGSGLTDHELSVLRTGPPRDDGKYYEVQELKGDTSPPAMALVRFEPPGKWIPPQLGVVIHADPDDDPEGPPEPTPGEGLGEGELVEGLTDDEAKTGEGTDYDEDLKQPLAPAQVVHHEDEHKPELPSLDQVLVDVPPNKSLWARTFPVQSFLVGVGVTINHRLVTGPLAPAVALVGAIQDRQMRRLRVRREWEASLQWIEELRKLDVGQQTQERLHAFADATQRLQEADAEPRKDADGKHIPLTEVQKRYKALLNGGRAWNPQYELESEVMIIKVRRPGSENAYAECNPTPKDAVGNQRAHAAQQQWRALVEGDKPDIPRFTRLLNEPDFMEVQVYNPRFARVDLFTRGETGSRWSSQMVWTNVLSRLPGFGIDFEDGNATYTSVSRKVVVAGSRTTLIGHLVGRERNMVSTQAQSTFDLPSGFNWMSRSPNQMVSLALAEFLMVGNKITVGRVLNAKYELVGTVESSLGVAAEKYPFAGALQRFALNPRNQEYAEVFANTLIFVIQKRILTAVKGVQHNGAQTTVENFRRFTPQEVSRPI
jgi:hypothetical protein